MDLRTMDLLISWFLRIDTQKLIIFRPLILSNYFSEDVYFILVISLILLEYPSLSTLAEPSVNFLSLCWVF